MIRRAAAVIDANRYLRRLISLARWAFPDVWNASAGSLSTAKTVLERWPHLSALANARRAALTGVIAASTRGATDVPARAERSAGWPPVGRRSGRGGSTWTPWPGTCASSFPTAKAAASYVGITRRTGRREQ